jgi:hypothetical protein
MGEPIRIAVRLLSTEVDRNYLGWVSPVDNELGLHYLENGLSK